MLQDVIIIAAMAENRVIGKDNSLPWSVKGNLAHFKEMTMGWPCIMGRKTWESLPKKPLPGRLNIIVSNSFTQRHKDMEDTEDKREGDLSNDIQKHFAPRYPSCPSVKIFESLESAIEYCANYEKIFICGGESIYKQAMPLANKIDLTLIPGQYNGDTFFPQIDSAVWTETGTVNFDNFSIISYHKVSKE